MSRNEKIPRRRHGIKHTGTDEFFSRVVKGRKKKKAARKARRRQR